MAMDVGDGTVIRELVFPKASPSFSNFTAAPAAKAAPKVTGGASDSYNRPVPQVKPAGVQARSQPAKPKPQVDWLKVLTDSLAGSVPGMKRVTEWVGPDRGEQQETPEKISKALPTYMAGVDETTATRQKEQRQTERGSDRKPQLQQADRGSYDKMDATGKAAVEWNTMLQVANEDDDKLLGLDKDKNGEVDLGEAEVGKQNTAAYRSAYKRAFGVEPDAKKAYNPAVMGVLNKLGVKDQGGQIEDYSGQGGFITNVDIDYGYLGPDKADRPRAQMLQRLTNSIGQLTPALAKTRVNYQGIDLPLSPTLLEDPGERANFIQAAARSLDLETGPDMSQFVNPGDRQRVDHLGSLYSGALGKGFTIDTLLDSVGEMDYKEAGINPDEWAAYLANKKKALTNAGGFDMDAAVAGAR